MEVAIIVVLAVIVVVEFIAIRTLLVKTERYEDITVDQTKYLQNISNLIIDSQRHLKNLDEKGVFQGEDEVVSMLLEEKIMKFDSENGAKAYSYFGTIVKRWLINYNNKNYKKLKQIGSFDDIEESFEDASDITLSRGITLSQFMEIWVESMYSNLDIVFTKTSEKRIADAVLTIFKTRHDLDIFKKKALYIYIREMTDCETPHLTRVVSTLKEDFYKLHQKYHNAGRLLIKEE